MLEVTIYARPSGGITWTSPSGEEQQRSFRGKSIEEILALIEGLGPNTFATIFKATRNRQYLGWVQMACLSAGISYITVREHPKEKPDENPD